MGFVYLICDLDRPNTYKIGVTKKSNIEERKKELQTGNSSELLVCNSYETTTPYKLENMLHRKYYSNNIKNEWFALTDEEAMSFKDECKKYQKIIDSLKENPFY